MENNLIENENITRLQIKNKIFIVVGTAHVSQESVRLVEDVITTEKPDTVCVELCEARLQSKRDSDHWRKMDIINVIKEKKAVLLLSNLLLSSFQQKIAAKMDITPGQEMLSAVEKAESMQALLCPVDRNIRVTLLRTWRSLGIWQKGKLFFHLIFSMGGLDEIDQESIEKMKKEDMLQSLLSELGESFPDLHRILIDERDLYLCSKIKTAPGDKIVAVVGAGHVPGIKKYWDEPLSDLETLQEIPPGSKTGQFFKWFLPGAVLIMICLGFFYGGKDAGTGMIAWWVIINGIMAALGAILALAHPLTILASFLAAPLTSLNPMIAAGWVAGLVEAFTRKPLVADFEDLPQDIKSFKGFWTNKVTKILLVVCFTNIGSMLGTFAAIPLMMRLYL